MFNEAVEPQYAGDAGFGFIIWTIFLAVYLYAAYTQYKIAFKCNCADSAWWSFIPVMNAFLLIKMANKEWWYAVLFLVPIVNIWAIFSVWIGAAKNAGHSALWGVFAVLPFLNFIAFYVMAFTDGEQTYKAPSPPNQPSERREPTHIG